METCFLSQTNLSGTLMCHQLLSLSGYLSFHDGPTVSWRLIQGDPASHRTGTRTGTGTGDGEGQRQRQ